MTTATLTIIHLMNDRSHAVQHIRGIDATIWDSAVMRAAAELRQMHKDCKEIVSAVLSIHSPNAADQTLNKVFQPREWQTA